MTRPARSLALVVPVALSLALLTAACAADGDPSDQGSAPAGSADQESGDTTDVSQSDEGDAAGGDGQSGEGLTVVASVYPLAWVAEQLAPGAEVVLLTEAGDEPHDIDLTPRSREAIETADLVLYMGDIGYQPQVEDAVGDRGGETVSFAEAVGEGAVRERAAGGDDDDHDDDHGHEDEAVDPHAWFDAELMAEVTEAAGAALASADASGADGYQEAAEALAADFRDLAAEISDLLGDDCAHDRVVVSHEAYAYLLRPHGLRQEGISGSGGHGPASPQRIAELVRLVRDEGMDHVLAEPVEGREDAQAVAAEADAEVLDIRSLEVIDDEALAGQGFLELLGEQARTTARALGCE